MSKHQVLGMVFGALIGGFGMFAAGYGFPQYMLAAIIAAGAGVLIGTFFSSRSAAAPVVRPGVGMSEGQILDLFVEMLEDYASRVPGTPFGNDFADFKAARTAGRAPTAALPIRVVNSFLGNENRRVNDKLEITRLNTTLADSTAANTDLYKALTDLQKALATAVGNTGEVGKTAATMLKDALTQSMAALAAVKLPAAAPAATRTPRTAAPAPTPAPTTPAPATTSSP